MTTRVAGPILVVAFAGGFVLAGTRAESAVMLNPNHSCSFCHSVHAGVPGQVPLGVNAQAEATCLGCHGPAGISTLKADVHTNDPKKSKEPFRLTCLDCHDAHDNQTNQRGGTNLKLMKAWVPLPLYQGAPRDTIGGTLIRWRPVSFENLGTGGTPPYDIGFRSFCDESGEAAPAGGWVLSPPDSAVNDTWDRVCDTCHLPDISRHNRLDPGNHGHQSTNTCTQHHLHSSGFLR